MLPRSKMEVFHMTDEFLSTLRRMHDRNTWRYSLVRSSALFEFLDRRGQFEK